MKKESIVFIALSLVVSGIVGGGALLSAKESASTARKKPTLYGSEVREPSGLAFHPGKNCLVVVGDEGDLAEISLEGETLTQKIVGGDLEGIVADPTRKVFYAVDETAGSLLVLNWEDYSIIDRVDLAPIIEKAGLSAKGTDGFEGIALQPSEGKSTITLWLGHQTKPTALVPLDLEGDPIRISTREGIEVPITEIAGMSFDPKTGDLWLLSDKDDLACRISETGEVLEQRPIPGKNQEGLAILPDGSWWIADDSGGVFKVQPDLP